MYYGFDVGGTKIELAVFDSQLNQVWHKRLSTPQNDYPALLAVLTRLTDEADQHFGSSGKIGIGIPGHVDVNNGTIYTVNIPAAKGKPLAADLQPYLKRPIRINNDANCFTLSEAWHPEFRQYNDVLGITLGTGLGGGLVINGQIVNGLNMLTGEIGHLRLTLDALEILGVDIPQRPCGCGQRGCFEGYLSGQGFAWLYHHFYAETLTTPEIIQRYIHQHPLAKQHVDRYLSLLGAYLGQLLTLFDPELVVIGGGLSHFAPIYQQLAIYLPRYLFPHAILPRIAQSRYGDCSGARGAALLNIASDTTTE